MNETLVMRETFVLYWHCRMVFQCWIIVKIGEEDSTISASSVSDMQKPPDGGWGWFVVFASFMIHVLGKWIMVKMCQNVELIVKLWYFYNGKCGISDRKFKLKHNYEALIQYQPDFFHEKISMKKLGSDLSRNINQPKM